MILSLKPPYDINSNILHLIGSISIKLGEVNALFLQKQSPSLRKQNRIKTIHSSLQIEGNTLSEDQITALIDSKRIIGPEKDVIEVLNAIKVYENIGSYKPSSQSSFLEAHRQLMLGLIENPGKYRNKGVGIVKGEHIAHIAPPSENVGHLMKNLFRYLKNDKDPDLIKSCVFHYEMEFIHPFADGNGRMGRLWQTVILMRNFPVFEFLPFETIISKNQKNYYDALSFADKTGKSTVFIEYMLEIIELSLAELLNFKNRILKDTDRLAYFQSLGFQQFSRKDYMHTFKHISSATASRDLLKGLEINLITKQGEKNQTIYRFLNR